VARLITALGKTVYTDAVYYLPARPGHVHKTPYAPVATAALVGGISDAAVLVTPEARENNWEGCRDALGGIGIAARAVDIPLGVTEDEIWEVFTALLEAVGDVEEVVLDVTYSLRHLPFVLLASLTYLTAFRRVSVRGIHYGAFDARPKDGPVPIFDLAPLVTLSDWYHAMRNFAETGSTRQLGRSLRQGKRPLFQRFGPNPAYDQLRSALEGLGWSLSTGLPLEAGLDAARAVAAIQTLRGSPSPLPIVNTALEPLRGILEGVALPQTTADKTGSVLDQTEVERELRVAALYAEWGQTDRALLILREWMINRWLLTAGAEGPSWLDYAKARHPTERVLNALAERARVGEASPGAELGSLWGKITTSRNAVAHGGFQAELVKERREVVAQLVAECRSAAGEPERWRNAIPGPLGRLLITPLGLSPGVLFTALRNLSPDLTLVITSRDAEALVREAIERAGKDPARVQAHVVAEPHRCFDEVGPVIAWARPTLLDAKEVLINVTGGTTAMQYLVERIAAQAERFGVPTTRYALLDRRPREEQEREPYVLGEAVELRGDAPAGEDRR
jgi:hypothetical protein